MQRTARYFENSYEDFSPDKPSRFLNENNTKFCEELQQNIIHFNENRLQYLNTSIDKNINGESVYSGVAGIVLYYYKCATNKSKAEDTALLKKAINYINLDRTARGRISFLCGDAGPLALAAVMSYKLGKERPNSLPHYKDIIERLLLLESLAPSSPDELLYGSVGYLYALAFVNHECKDEKVPAKLFHSMIGYILQSGKNLSAKLQCSSPLAYKWHDKFYYGGAHGMAGILYILLQCREYITCKDLEVLVKPSIDWLLEEKYDSGNFPSSQGSASDRLVQWCHGAPGFVPLLLLCYKVFGDEKYMSMALKCGEVVWSRGLCTKGFSLCHGVCGNAYTFIQLYQITKDPKYLHRCACFTDWLVSAPSSGATREYHEPDRPQSLFEGLAGQLYFLNDLDNIMEAKFPAYTLEI